MSHVDPNLSTAAKEEFNFGVWWHKYGKTAGLFIGGLIITLKQVLDDGRFAGNDWHVLATAIGAGVLAYFIPNLTSGINKYLKPIAYAYVAVVATLPTLLVGGLTQSEWIDLVLLAAVTLGIIPLPAPQRPAELELVQVK